MPNANDPPTSSSTQPPQAFPRLRLLDVMPVHHDGRDLLLLRDPLQLSDLQVAVPPTLAPLMALADGTRDLAGLRSAFAVRYQVDLPPAAVERLFDALDEALLLANDRSQAAQVDLLTAYRAAPYRPPALAGTAYPADPAALATLLDGWLAAVPDGPAEADLVGLVSPHIDYARGGPVYAQVWQRARAAARAAEVVVILGTDHYGGHGSFTLTRQHYATPYGRLPTDTALVDALAAALGAEATFAGELRHRTEHSVELAAVWLHHIRGGAPVAALPVLTGSFGHFLNGDGHPDTDPTTATFLDVVRTATAGRRLLVVAAADLAHIGPAFGGAPVDRQGAARLRAADDRLMARTCAGDASGFFDAIRSVNDRDNVCGTSPIYLALRLTGGAPGQPVAYDQCPADSAGTSLVSVCGVVWGETDGSDPTPGGGP